MKPFRTLDSVFQISASRKPIVMMLKSTASSHKQSPLVECTIKDAKTSIPYSLEPPLTIVQMPVAGLRYADRSSVTTVG